MNDRRAIIIGATSGIGLATARLLHDDGWTLGLMGRRTALLKAARQEMGERVLTRTVDVCRDDASEQLMSLIDEMGDVELIFHVSGIGKQNMTLEPEIELDTVETNALGFTRMVTAAYRYFVQRGGGHLAAVSSIAGTKGLGAAPAYSATKRFQNTYMQCLAQQSRMRGVDITLTDIRPGFVDTALLTGKYPMLMQPDKVAQQIVKAIYAKQRKVVIDWRYAMLVAVWRLIPDWLWERMRVKN